MKHISVVIAALCLPFILSSCGAAKDMLFSSGSTLFDNHMVDASKIYISASPQGENILFSANGAGDAGIFCLNLANLKVTTIIDTKLYEAAPIFIPQDQSIVYSVDEHGGTRLYILRPSSTQKADSEYDQILALRSGRAEPLTQTQGGTLSFADSGPVASPDGKYIYFSRAYRTRNYSMGGTVWTDFDLCKLRLSNMKITRLTHSNFNMMSPPQVSPKTGEVIFSYEKLTPPPARSESIEGVIVIGKNDTMTKLLTKDIKVAGICFGKSRDQLIFISDFKEEYDYELCVSDMSFSNPYTLTKEKSYLLMPRYDEQNKTIYFLNDPNRNGRYQLWYLPVSPNGSANAKQLANSTLFTEPLKWSP